MEVQSRDLKVVRAAQEPEQTENLTTTMLKVPSLRHRAGANSRYQLKHATFVARGPYRAAFQFAGGACIRIHRQ